MLVRRKSLGIIPLFLPFNFDACMLKRRDALYMVTFVRRVYKITDDFFVDAPDKNVRKTLTQTLNIV